MTEEEWRTGSDPQSMLELSFETATDRKLRLFGCACCRRVWDLLPKDCFRGIVSVAEHFADGHASANELEVAKNAGGAALVKAGEAGVTGPSYCAMGCAWSCARNAETAANYPLWVFDDVGELVWEAALLRDIFGNPFRPVVADSAWLTPTAVSIASAIYEDRAFDRLPILADALEEAGCTDADLLLHCRQPGEHVRGCWAVDLVLGKM